MTRRIQGDGADLSFSPPSHSEMPSNKSFRTKVILAKASKQNRCVQSLAEAGARALAAAPPSLKLAANLLPPLPPPTTAPFPNGSA